ncbi:hypothetical protein BKA70DRAFT_1242609 [Coprinopsis sp. MPI-PUGE-AT-0042]|nr:hypothetical protein BKA70DRAFT_1242609 [Coprinopsis sp. MPI-PUGE-AT-0042]
MLFENTDATVEQVGRSQSRMRTPILGLSPSHAWEQAPLNQSVASFQSIDPVPSASVSAPYLPRAGTSTSTQTPEHLHRFGYAASFEGKPGRFSVRSSRVPDRRKRRYIAALDNAVGAMFGSLPGLLRSSSRIFKTSPSEPSAAHSMSRPAPAVPARGTRTPEEPPTLAPSPPTYNINPTPQPPTSAGPSRIVTPLARAPSQCVAGHHHEFWTLDPDTPITVSCSNCGLRREFYGPDVGTFTRGLMHYATCIVSLPLLMTLLDLFQPVMIDNDTIKHFIGYNDRHLALACLLVGTFTTVTTQSHIKKTILLHRGGSAWLVGTRLEDRLTDKTVTGMYLIALSYTARTVTPSKFTRYTFEPAGESRQAQGHGKRHDNGIIITSITLS